MCGWGVGSCWLEASVWVGVGVGVVVGVAVSVSVAVGVVVREGWGGKCGCEGGSVDREGLRVMVVRGFGCVRAYCGRCRVRG